MSQKTSAGDSFQHHVSAHDITLGQQMVASCGGSLLGEMHLRALFQAKLSENMMDAWINFARTGDPSTEGLGPWPAYDAENRSTMILGPDAGAMNDPLPEERKILNRS